MIEINIVVATFVALLALRGLNGLLGTVAQYVRSRKMQRELDESYLFFTDDDLLQLIVDHYDITVRKGMAMSIAKGVYKETGAPMFMLRFGTNIPPLKGD